MTFRIDRTGSVVPARRAREDQADTDEHQPLGLPVPIGAPRRVFTERRADDSGFAAQLLGQDGEKRGLRGGEPVIDAARRLYSKVEWSGPSDRRARKGRQARTEA